MVSHYAATGKTLEHWKKSTSLSEQGTVLSRDSEPLKAEGVGQLAGGQLQVLLVFTVSKAHIGSQRADPWLKQFAQPLYKVQVQTNMFTYSRR